MTVSDSSKTSKPTITDKASTEQLAQINNEMFAKLTVDDLVRGDTPDNIEKRCLELCQTYLGGSWANAKSTADVTVKRISGGLTNQLYHVQLNESVKRVTNPVYKDEPSDVAIKIYQEKHMKNYGNDDSERLNDNIILTIMSETNIGPKVYGIFNDGVILAYCKHEQFRAKHQSNPKLLKELATILAKIHHLNVPINKANNLMMEDFERNIAYGYDKLNSQALVEELQLKNFLNKDLRSEFQDLLRYIKQVGSPVVFCHHDFRGGNIMVTEPDQKISIVDLEYCGYGQRGYDFGTVLSEWGKKNMLDQMEVLIPSDGDIEKLVRYYIEACGQIEPGYSSKPENSVNQIVREAKLFYLIQHMFFLSLMIKTETAIIPSLPFDPKSKMIRLESVYERYNQIKEALIQDGTLERID